MAMSLPPKSQSECWNSVTEQGIFLQKDLKYVVDVVLPPPGAQQSAVDGQKFESSTASSAELSRNLLAASSAQYKPYHKFFNYRQRALTGLWLYKRQNRILRIIKQAESGHQRTDDDDNKQDTAGVVSFSSHVSLLLLLPLLKSQSRNDPALAGSCIDILLACLRQCSPNSLKHEPQNCIDGLVELLQSWLQQEGAGSRNVSVKQGNVVAALIAIACGR